MDTEVTTDKDYLSTGRITMKGELEEFWQILTDYDGLSSWLPKGLDSPDGGKRPVFIQGILFHPEWPALELLYGIRFLGFLNRDNISVVFAIEEEQTPQTRRLSLTLTRKFSFLSEANYTITLSSGRAPGITEALFSVRTKLPSLVRFFLPWELYKEMAHYFMERVIENLAEARLSLEGLALEDR